ncbi:MAG: hypothetical protein UHD07_00745 [Ruminobacter sp.]|nr:hypothetical protein [Ruminobacter sp.]
MRVELNQSEIVYNFNTDYDDSDQSYSFVLMTKHNNYFFQILLTYSSSKISTFFLRPNGTGKMFTDYSITPRTICLSPEEISSSYEIKKAINEMLVDMGCKVGELHDYITTNFDEFLKQLLQDAQNRGLVDDISLFSFHSFFKSNADVL